MASLFERFQAGALRVVRDKLNNFNLPGSSKSRSTPFYVGNYRVGTIRDDFLTEILEYPNVFESLEEGGNKKVRLAGRLSTYATRTEAVNGVLKDLQQRGKFLVALGGWRNENYVVCTKYRREKLFAMERAGCGLLGIITYGVHMNGYVLDSESNGRIKMWLGRRSPTKQTYPNYIDQLAAGGISDEDSSIRDCMIRECVEEAAIPADYTSQHLQSAGVLFYCYDDERGIIPEVEYIFDLRLPAEFVPRSTDGEMQSHTLYPIEEVIELISRDDFKPNCAGVVIDFLLRNGIITPDNCQYYVEFQQLLHNPMVDYD